MWEGCCSVLDEKGDPLYAKVPRYRKIRVQYLDEKAQPHNEIVESFVAHVLQHETDHNNGIIYTDLVSPDDLISLEEYQAVRQQET